MKFYYLALAFLLASCAEQNTQTSNGFSSDAFKGIREGIAKSEVESLIGTAFTYYTHVIYDDGTGNNYREVINPDPTKDYRIFRYVGVHSRPIRASSDYRVYEIFYDKNWRVSGRQCYSTD